MFCSFKVKSPDVLAIPGQTNLLDRGINVFSAEIPDLDGFTAELSALGIEVLEVHRIGELEPNKLEDLLLPGESASVVTGALATHLAGVLSGSGRTKA